jgi:hypothetical protein
MNYGGFGLRRKLGDFGRGGALAFGGQLEFQMREVEIRTLHKPKGAAPAKA